MTAAHTAGWSWQRAVVQAARFLHDPDATACDSRGWSGGRAAGIRERANAAPPGHAHCPESA